MQSRFSSASSATSSSPRTPSRTRSQPRSSAGRETACRQPGCLDRHGRAEPGHRPIRREQTFVAQGRAARPTGEPAGRGGRDDHDPRRSPRPRLHVLSPGPRRRRAGRADTARGGWADDERDRPRVPGGRACDGPAARPREEEDPLRRHPVPSATRPSPPRQAASRPRGPVPGLQRGLRGDRGATQESGTTCAARQSGSRSFSAC